MLMKKPAVKGVRIAELKARLSHYLAQVRGGRTLTVLDRNTPVATIEPIRVKPEKLRIRPATRDWNTVQIPPPPDKVRGVDSLELLMEDRRRR